MLTAVWYAVVVVALLSVNAAGVQPCRIVCSEAYRSRLSCMAGALASKPGHQHARSLPAKGQPPSPTPLVLL